VHIVAGGYVSPLLEEDDLTSWSSNDPPTAFSSIDLELYPPTLIVRQVNHALLLEYLAPPLKDA